MVTATRSRPGRSRQCVLVQKPNGQLTPRVQAPGPEHFGILSIDCAKARSQVLLCDFYGKVLIPPTEFAHTRGDLQAAIDRLRQALDQYGLRDHIVALERTGEYHRPVQRAFRQAGSEVRLVHPFATKQFRQPADAGNKTDDTDLAAIHRAAVNGFGLIELPLPAHYQQLQLAIRHRRDLVYKTSKLCCQLRERLHAVMPGYADCFEDLWDSKIAILVARNTGSAEAVRLAGVKGMSQIVAQAGVRCHQATLGKIRAWGDTAPPGHPQVEWQRRILGDLGIRTSASGSGLTNRQRLRTFRPLGLHIAWRSVGSPTPDTAVWGHSPDVPHVLVNLQELDLTKTKVTAERIATLQKALPKCKIEGKRQK